MTTILVILLFASLTGLVAGAIKPSLFAFLLKGRATRKTVLLVFGLLSAGFFVALGLLPATENIQKIDAITEGPATDEEWIQGIVFQGALAEVSLRYIEATVYTDTLFRDVQKLSDEERIALLDQTIQKWVEARVASEQFSAMAEFLPDYDASVSYKNNGSRFSLIEEVLAATVEEDIEKAWQKKKELGEEELLQLIDKAPMGQRVREAAKIFGTSIEVAEVVLQDLRAEETKKALKEAEKYDTYSKAAQTIQAGAKVAVFVGGMAAGGGMVTLAGKAAYMVTTSVAGAGLVMDVSKTAVDVGIADKEGGEWSVAAIAKAREAEFFKKMSLVVGITDVAKAFGQFGKVVDAAGGLKNLLTADGLKKIAGNAELMKDMKTDASGNLQTIVDSGPATWDFLTQNPEAKEIVMNAAASGKMVFSGTNKEIAVKDPPTTKAITDFVKRIFSEAQTITPETLQETPESIPTAAPSVRIIRACSSGQFVRYTDCDSGQAIARDALAPGKHRFGTISPDGRSFKVLISGGEGSYRVFVQLSNGESQTVGYYPANGTEVFLTPEAESMGWRSSGVTIYAP